MAAFGSSKARQSCARQKLKKRRIACWRIKSRGESKKAISVVQFKRVLVVR